MIYVLIFAIICFAISGIGSLVLICLLANNITKTGMEYIDKILLRRDL